MSQDTQQDPPHMRVRVLRATADTDGGRLLGDLRLGLTRRRTPGRRPPGRTRPVRRSTSRRHNTVPVVCTPTATPDTRHDKLDYRRDRPTNDYRAPTPATGPQQRQRERPARICPRVWRDGQVQDVCLPSLLPLSVSREDESAQRHDSEKACGLGQRGVERLLRPYLEVRGSTLEP